ncbi:hypothetical protein [Chlorogloeopsis sp. ULAP02]
MDATRYPPGRHVDGRSPASRRVVAFESSRPDGQLQIGTAARAQWLCFPA